MLFIPVLALTLFRHTCVEGISRILLFKLVEQECEMLDFKKGDVCKVKEIPTKNYDWSKNFLKVSWLFLLTGQGDIFSNKAKFLKFIFRRCSQFPKLNDSFPFAEANFSILSHYGINFYLLLLCLVRNTVQGSFTSLFYDLSFLADGLIIKISWCVTSARITDQQWHEMQDAVLGGRQRLWEHPTKLQGAQTTPSVSWGYQDGFLHRKGN